MLNDLKYNVWRFFEKTCKFFNILKIFTTRVGLKIMNASSFRASKYIEKDGLVFMVNASKLFLGPDFLKDNYTLLDCPLKNSPHYGFVECLSQKGNPEHTDYIKRYYQGTLDGRFGHSRIRYFSIFFKKNDQRRENIISGNIEPVMVYEWKGRTYIQDGKHRAALCAYLGKEIPCKLIDENTLFGGITACQLRIAKKSADKYSKHIQFFER
jgi:hypothetical protein